MASYIKLHRKLLNWGWFNKPEILSVFIYCLIRANYEDGDYQGHKVLRGQFITSPDKIAQATGLTYQCVRTVLNKLILTNEINKQTTNKYTIITVCNYDSYQGLEKDTNKQTPNKSTNNQQTTNKQLTTSKKLEEIKENEEVNIYGFDLSFLDPVFNETFLMWLDYKIERKEKYKTQKSLELCYQKLLEFSKSNPETARRIIEDSMANNYKGFFEPKQTYNGTKKSNGLTTETEQREFLEAVASGIARAEFERN